MTMKKQLFLPKQIISTIVSASALILSFSVLPVLAGDIFRTSNTHNIGDNTESAFNAIFKDGNYPEATRYLKLAESTESNEPLAYAMQASLAYMNQDWDALKVYSTKTLQTAQQLNRTDPLRSNLYTAVGNFLEGAYSFKQDGPVGAMTKLQKVFDSLDEAKKLAPNDPEVNLLKGYMDLMLAVNLPFSDPSQGIEQLEKYAAPEYLANRGIAIAYRDLKQYNKALDYVNRALQQTPKNPELHYLKAQILVAQGKKQKNSSFYQEAKKNFTAALTKPNQLPKGLVAQIFYEHCKNENLLDNKDRDCNALRNPIKNGTGTWGPVELPKLD